jgi:hypothetical protein
MKLRQAADISERDVDVSVRRIGNCHVGRRQLLRALSGLLRSEPKPLSVLHLLLMQVRVDEWSETDQIYQVRNLMYR